MKKKVLFTATVDSHILNFHTPYLKYFKDNGYEVHVATNGTEKIPYCDVKHTVSFERSPFRLNNLKARKQLKKIIDTEQFEIIHTHTPMGSVVTRLAALNARKKFNTRVIYTAHGFHFYDGAPVQNWLFFYPVEKYLARYTDTLITINQEDYQRAKNKFKTRVEYVPGVGIDESKFKFKMSKKEKSDLRKSLGLKDTDFVLIYAAELNKNKNQKMLIEAMSEIIKINKNVHLLLPGNDSLNKFHGRLVRDYGLIMNVHILGHRTDVPHLLRISDVAISTSIREGLPVNILEAIYTGLPVIGTDCRGNKDLIIQNNSVLINKQDMNSLVCEINKLHETYFVKNNIVKKSDLKSYSIEAILSTVINKIYKQPAIALIIPTCTDLNRGDQALVFETKHIIDDIYASNYTYVMSGGETSQIESEGMIATAEILKHPSRFGQSKSNVNYNYRLKLYWGFISVFDLLQSLLILNKYTRTLILPFLSFETKKSLDIYKKSKSIFVKGGGFLHDYSGGAVGIYTMYYQTYHIRLATALGKKVFIMPNSFGPFKSKITKKMLNKILNKCEIVTSRESKSSSKTSNGLGRNIDKFADLAFYLENRTDLNVINYLKKNKIPYGKSETVAITVRPYRFYGYDNPFQKYYEYKKAFVEFIQYLQSEGSIVYLVVHTHAENDHEDDSLCIREIYNLLPSTDNVYIIKNDKFNCYDLMSLYSKCDYLIGTRFHSVIFALKQSIPSVAITYGGHKGDGIMADINMEEYAIKIGELNSASLISKYLDLKNNRNNLKNKINTYLQDAYFKRTELIVDLKEKVEKK
jgi:polysaccharide pyruvyl transferase WcaK-like protein/glycosyltransferase involved in cell wall biosynthesis